MSNCFHWPWSGLCFIHTWPASPANHLHIALNELRMQEQRMEKNVVKFEGLLIECTFQW